MLSAARWNSTAKLMFGLGLIAGIGTVLQGPLVADEQGQIDRDEEGVRALQGSWSVTKAKAFSNGKERTEKDFAQCTVVIQGNDVTFEPIKGTRVPFAITRIADEKPAAIYLASKTPKGVQNASGWMIYSSDGDKLKLAFFDAMEDRPDSFEPREGLILLELLREKVKSK